MGPHPTGPQGEAPRRQGQGGRHASHAEESLWSPAPLDAGPADGPADT